MGEKVHDVEFHFEVPHPAISTHIHVQSDQSIQVKERFDSLPFKHYHVHLHFWGNHFVLSFAISSHQVAPA
jgi:hypothetical protein